mmetsp:Transcript_65648/g.156926  ORF Transcript_65648/g.156926 Transcript_65648/m.156926 type:complete len:225 (+) Transcript_65648:550-1224(+)
MQAASLLTLPLKLPPDLVLHCSGCRRACNFCRPRCVGLELPAHVLLQSLHVLHLHPDLVRCHPGMLLLCGAEGCNVSRHLCLEGLVHCFLQHGSWDRNLLHNHWCCSRWRWGLRSSGDTSKHLTLMSAMHVLVQVPLGLEALRAEGALLRRRSVQDPHGLQVAVARGAPSQRPGAGVSPSAAVAATRLCSLQRSCLHANLVQQRLQDLLRRGAHRVEVLDAKLL